MTAHTWSQVPLANSTADSTVNWREVQDPTTVTPSMRSMMAAIAKWRDDRNGSVLTGGTGSALTITTNQGFTTLEDGFHVTARMSATVQAGATLEVDGTGAKAIQTEAGNTVLASELVTGSLQTFTYNQAEDAWVALNPRRYMASGARCMFNQSSAPTGWTKSTVTNDAMLKVTTGAMDLGGSTYWASIFTANRYLTTNEMPLHDHASNFTLSTDGAHTHTYTFTQTEGNNRENFGGAAQHDNVWRNTNNVTTGTSGAHTHGFSGATDAQGAGAAFDFDLQYVDYIIAEKD